MSGCLTILCCENFHDDMAAVVAAEPWDDVTTRAFPARCGRPPLTRDEVTALVPEGAGGIRVFGRACLAGLAGGAPCFPEPCLRKLEQCFHLVAPPSLVDDAIEGGAYLLTPAWLLRWRERLADMGFAAGDAAGFFQDFARELTLLDTCRAPGMAESLDELAAATGLPARRVPVGLDYLRLLVSHTVLTWRSEAQTAAGREAAQRHARELADHVSAMDFLQQLARASDEASAIGLIGDLFRMLFAPQSLHYLRVVNNTFVPDDAIPAGVANALTTLSDAFAWTPDHEGFLLRISHGDEEVGRIAVLRLAFPQYRERYLNLALAIAGICGLAIDNVRSRDRLIEARKMASLGILVAGVAHEINTPLGVSLATSTALQGQTQTLAARFADRSMTRSDLETYLARSEDETNLMRNNLERIGQLIEAFRQVAVGKPSPASQPFALRECLDDVLHSLGERLAQAHVAVDLDCQSSLTVNGVATDWATIFINLVDNSLDHGFRDRVDGVIGIRVRCDTRRLRIDYRDDGCGMDAQTLARIFDPFFTTNLQRGMGLGMHLVFNLITHRMGGSIRCDSRPGAGTHFHIEVPT